MLRLNLTYLRTPFLTDLSFFICIYTSVLAWLQFVQRLCNLFLFYLTVSGIMCAIVTLSLKATYLLIFTYVIIAHVISCTLARRGMRRVATVASSRGGQHVWAWSCSNVVCLTSILD